MKKKFILAGIGEVLFDVLPEQKKLGGAPVNFSFHAQQLGLNTYPVSSVGLDADGREILVQLKRAGISTKYIQKVDFPTSTAQVSLDGQGVPKFIIIENVAWDYLQWIDPLAELAANVDAVCFGSLAQRSAQSRRFIQEFLRHTRPDCLRIFDINLRQQYYSSEIIESSLQAANVLKLNDDELTILQNLLDLPKSPEEALFSLRDRLNLQIVTLTRGAEGSVLIDRQTSNYCRGNQVAVVDTVGAGDAYTAVLAFGILHQMPLEWINRMANRVAAYVGSQAGATPVLPDSLVAEIKQDSLTFFQDESK